VGSGRACGASPHSSPARMADAQRAGCSRLVFFGVAPTTCACASCKTRRQLRSRHCCVIPGGAGGPLEGISRVSGQVVGVLLQTLGCAALQPVDSPTSVVKQRVSSHSAAADTGHARTHVGGRVARAAVECGDELQLVVKASPGQHTLRNARRTLAVTLTRYAPPTVGHHPQTRARRRRQWRSPSTRSAQAAPHRHSSSTLRRAPRLRPRRPA
jgi:hypothetical protein